MRKLQKRKVFNFFSVSLKCIKVSYNIQYIYIYFVNVLESSPVCAHLGCIYLIKMEKYYYNLK